MSSKNPVGLLLPLILSACAGQPTARMPEACKAPQTFSITPAYTADSTDSLDNTYHDSQGGSAMGDFRGELAIWLSMSNEAARNNDENKARCAIAWLDTWAQTGHMREDPHGSATGQQSSRNETAWALQSIATAYAVNLRWRAESSERRHIDRWLRKVASDVTDAGIDNVPSSRQNGQYLWAGAAVMAAGVATGDGGLVATANKVYRAGIDAIRPDGSLAKESGRGEQALRAHLQAIIPLTMMTELARRQGNNWSAYKPERLARLVDFSLHGITDPQWATGQFGTLQENAWMNPCSEEWAWTPFWLRHDTQRISRLLPSPGNCSWLRLGGDLPLLKARGLFEPSTETMHISP